MISGLANINFGLKSLVKLSLKKNRLVKLKGIEKFPKVNYLKLSRNNITSMNEVQRLGSLDQLKGVSLYKNPVSEDKAVYTKSLMTICKNLESLDHTDIKELQLKYGLSGKGYMLK